jgi:cyanate permease
MPVASFKIYRYRWTMLLVFMFIVTMNQMLWITFAPITSKAAQFYGVSDLLIGLLSMSFMIVYLFVAIPASWVIDTYGFRLAVGIGAVLTGVFGLLRGLAPANYTVVLLAQIGIAIGQPFILNSLTKVAARWFPLTERATATGLGTLAMYLGIIAGMFLTPILTLKYGLRQTLLIFGIASVVSAVTFMLFAKEHPPTPPCPPGHEERSLMFDGLKSVFRQKDFIWLLVIFFIGLGVFNAVSTWIENIIRPRGFSIGQAGVLGGLMVTGGVVGAAILPIFSDRSHRRKPFIILALLGSGLGLLGMTFAAHYGLLLFSGFLFGFSLLSAGPIGFQYGAEVTYPAPEGTSNGLLILMGQISGIIFIFAMDGFKSKATGSMTASMLVSIGLFLLAFLLSFKLRESALLKGHE